MEQNRKHFMAEVQEIFDRLLESLSNKPLTLYQLVYLTKVSARTVNLTFANSAF